MANSYQQFKKLDLPQIDKDILTFWKDNQIFEKSISQREGQPTFTFYEGPPSVNGMPGIHHVISRTIKDLYCRFHSLKGRKVNRKAGWDTHGLPIELAVEKKLGITKEDIGKTISVEAYNQKCRAEAMRYIDIWNDITEKMGYWVDLSDPYITYENNYIETLWFLLGKLHEKGLLYKGYTIQPYSPAAGTGLSSHELNQPGCYREVKDLSAVAQFEVQTSENSQFLFQNSNRDQVFFIAWTTTPWTLPSNTALALGAKIDYVQVDTFNPYTHLPVSLILAKDRLHYYFRPENADLPLDSYETGSKILPYKVVGEYKGKDLAGIRYEQLLAYAQPTEGDAFITLLGNFVTTEDGTGIVHIAPSFGADDMLLARQNGIGALTLVDKQGRFVDAVTDFAGRPVKNYDNEPKATYRSVDVDISIKLKKENKAFNVKKYSHNYPHCWRTDKPIIYYPLDSWFVRTTAYKKRLVELNKTINWKPKSTGEGRFGNWLENLVDWNLSRSRFWGVPLPIWRTEDGSEEICISSVAQLSAEVDKAVAAGLMSENPISSQENFDLHRPYIDRIILVSPSGKKMTRELDLIDVWFDSGAMPYAQWHYPFENMDIWKQAFPADFIAEGVDQTRGWFFTLHAIATMLFDSVAFKNVVSTGLVLAKDGRKMSKRLGNTINPFSAMDAYGADPNRWYMIVNADPWDNLRFDLEGGVREVRNKFFGTLFNTYSFFTLYANVDGFRYAEAEIDTADRPEIDRWILSLLNTLIKNSEAFYTDYEATKAARAIQEFVIDHLSNWYVRLCRRRFWKGEYAQDKISAYQTLYQCLEVVAQLMSPIAPFFSDFLFQNLNKVTGRHTKPSVHLTDWPSVSESTIDQALEERMQIAQDASSMVLSLRKQVQIRVRQPLQRILVPILDSSQKDKLEQVKRLILSEVNVKELAYVTDTSGIVKKSIKLNFAKLGRKLGKKIKAVKQIVEGITKKNKKTKTIEVIRAGWGQTEIAALEQAGSATIEVAGEKITLLLDEFIIISSDIEGWLVKSMGDLTVALDIILTDELKAEGLARELVNRIQNIRKDRDLALTDRISLTISHHDTLAQAITHFQDYIQQETLATSIKLIEPANKGMQVDLGDSVSVWIDLEVV